MDQTNWRRANGQTAVVESVLRLSVSVRPPQIPYGSLIWRAYVRQSPTTGQTWHTAFARTSRLCRSSLRSWALGGKKRWEWLPLHRATGCQERSSDIRECLSFFGFASINTARSSEPSRRNAEATGKLWHFTTFLRDLAEQRDPPRGPTRSDRPPQLLRPSQQLLPCQLLLSNGLHPPSRFPQDPDRTPPDSVFRSSPPCRPSEWRIVHERPS